MTTKPKPHKAPAAETGINPKLAALAAKLDEAHAHARLVESRQKDADDIDAAENDCAIEYEKLSKLEHKLAKLAATNLEEMKLKARYAKLEPTDPIVAFSIVRDLRALDTPRWPHIRP
jgi:methionine-rich copper-binding protein CopC